MIRSTSSVSSALRRSRVVRSRIRTIRARDPSSPLVSPTRSTRSPVTIAWSRNSRARVVVSTRSSAPSSSASTV
jgi:hypothetical protein